MQNFKAGDIERQIHDGTLLEDIDRKVRLGKYLSGSLKIPELYLQDDEALVDIIAQLQRENNPILSGANEDVWIFMADHMEQGEDAASYARSGGKTNNYNRSKAKAYIDAYWKNYNPKYPTFHAGGGDCANFVSQVLHAGGMNWVDDGNPNHYTWTTNWYCKPNATNKDGDRRITLSWKVAASFRRHWEKRAARQLQLSYKDAIDNMKQLSREIYVGDPVQFCYASGVPYHTLVVTGFTWDAAAGVNDIVLASHTMDSNTRSLYNTMLKYPRDYQLRVFIIKEV